MEIIYLGAFPPFFLVKRSEGKIDSLYRDYESMVKGLRGIPDVHLKVITSPDIVSWPKGPLLLKREENYEEDVILVSELNISFIKQFWTILSLTYEAGKYIRNYNGKVAVIIPYMVFRHVFTLWLLKKIYPKKVYQICVVPDIFFPKKLVNRIMNAFTKRMASKFDAFILYTEKMSDFLHIKKEQYEVIEGFREVPNRKPILSTDFNLVYAGSLNLNYGIGRLIEAMSFVNDPNIQLHLYGVGTAEKIIKEACTRDKRIVFHGKVSNAKATEAIYSASALINPRNANDGKYTDYSFPSKDIEYMATGIPTLLCKLPGMPRDYYDYFVDMQEGLPKQIAQAIIHVKEMTVEERESLGSAARNFISYRMDSAKQAARIVELIKNIQKYDY